MTTVDLAPAVEDDAIVSEPIAQSGVAQKHQLGVACCSLLRPMDTLWRCVCPE